MYNETYLCDNNGNRMPSHPDAANPIAASGQTKATATAGDDLTLTVVAGATYGITCIDTAALLSITGVTSVAANIEWVAPSNKNTIIKIPVDKTTLYLEGTVTSKNIYLRRIL